MLKKTADLVEVATPNRPHHRALASEEVMRTTLGRVSTAGARAMTLEAHPAGQKCNKKS